MEWTSYWWESEQTMEHEYICSIINLWMIPEVRILACKWTLYANNLFSLVAVFIYNLIIQPSCKPLLFAVEIIFIIKQKVHLRHLIHNFPDDNVYGLSLRNYHLPLLFDY